MKAQTINSNLEAVLAPVKSVNSSEIFSNPKLILPSGFDRAIISGDTLYGFVSNNFKLVQPMDIASTFSEILDKRNIQYELRGKIDSKGNYQIRYSFLEKKKSPKVGDTISDMLGFLGGIAGKQSLSVLRMQDRLICTNGTIRSFNTEIFNKVRNTVNTHLNKCGIDFEKLIPIIESWIENNDDIFTFQEKLQDQELKTEQILPFFYEITKDTYFPESKFQDAYDRMKIESEILGYTKMNKYLAYNGLNYILEHDSMSMDITKVSNTDYTISSKAIELDLNLAMKNFNAIVKAEKDRLEKYQAENNGSSPRGKRKVLELV